MLLGQIVGRVSGARYEDTIRAKILEPLGMRATVYDPKATAPDRVAQGYRREGEAFVLEPTLGDGVGGAMGGLYSTVRDMARYAAYHLAAWPPRDEPEAGPLRRSSAREMQQMARYENLGASPASTDQPIRVRALGYGFGLAAYETCIYDHVVTHSGGLPGFGSNVLWLPEYGVGLVALANLTYANAGEPVRLALQALGKTGGLVPRTVEPAPALVAARDGTNAFLWRWDDAQAMSLVAGNFFLDQPADVWKKKLDALRDAHGACHPDGELDAENALRGKWKLACERGWLTASITLAPTIPPRVQQLEIQDGLPPDAHLTAAAGRAVALTSRADDASFAGAWLATSVDRKALTKKADDVRAGRGACTLDRALEGDGKTHATFALTCARSAARMTLVLDDAGKVTELSFRGPAESHARCAQ